MRRSRAVWVSFALAALLGCQHKEPINTVKALTAEAPTAAQVWIEFRGLVSFVFKKDGSVVSVFLSPGHSHPPVAEVNTEFLHQDNMSDPSWVASGHDDTGLAVWEFTNVSVDTGNVGGATLQLYDGKLDPGVDPNYTFIRWVPSMGDIFGATQEVDPYEIDAAAARGTWSVGELLPIFDQTAHKTENWDIGARMATPVADGVRLKLTLKTEGSPVKLLLRRDGMDEVIPVRGGGTVFLTAYPRKIPKAGEDMKHFPHYYELRKNLKTGPEATPTASGPSPYPARCAPSLFFPPDL